MSWLVTGGAGYIGSHVTQAMCDAEIPVVVIDDLSTGFAEFVAPTATFVEGTLLDGAAHHVRVAYTAVEGRAWLHLFLDHETFPALALPPGLSRLPSSSV